ncbi:hypothetical protein [Borrelia persica]|uniref:hypothetical protein n=1 Tax=Borrelia persica TaxID=44448 RepID=UPI000462FB4C|nr:hypothetical protein [Borrelia persica]
MKKICMVIIALGVSFLCCKQSSPVIETEKQEAYSQLSDKLGEIKELYEYVEPGTLSLSDAFKSKFGSDPSHQDKYIYAVLGGKKDFIGNLKKILVDIHDNINAYDKFFADISLYSILAFFGKDYFGDIIDFFYERPYDSLSKLKNVTDVQGLRVLCDDLEKFRVGWLNIIGKLQYKVKEIAKWCDKYLGAKGQADKKAEIEYYAEVQNESEILIIAIKYAKFGDPPKKVCVGRLCDEIYDLFVLKDRILNKVNDLVKVLAP